MRTLLDRVLYLLIESISILHIGFREYLRVAASVCQSVGRHLGDCLLGCREGMVVAVVVNRYQKSIFSS